jgi:uncharacterized membrane protein YdfJ with MMPL/SSD domain
MDVVVVAVVMALIFLFICFPSLFAAGSPFMFGGEAHFLTVADIFRFQLDWHWIVSWALTVK